MALPFQKQELRYKGQAEDCFYNVSEAVFWRLYCPGYTTYLRLPITCTASDGKLGEGLGTRLTLDYSC